MFFCCFSFKHFNYLLHISIFILLWDSNLLFLPYSLCTDFTPGSVTNRMYDPWAILYYSLGFSCCRRKLALNQRFSASRVHPGIVGAYPQDFWGSCSGMGSGTLHSDEFPDRSSCGYYRDHNLQTTAVDLRENYELYTILQAETTLKNIYLRMFDCDGFSPLHVGFL